MSDEGDDRGTLERRLCDARMGIFARYPPYPCGEGERKDLRRLLADAGDAIGECRRAMEALERRWEGIDPDEVFTFREDSEAIKGVFAALAKLKGGD